MRMIRFTALWCPSCLLMRPRYDKVFASRPAIPTVSYDYDECPAEVARWGIGPILPVLILEEDGKEIARLTGEKSPKELARWAEEWLR